MIRVLTINEHRDSASRGCTGPLRAASRIAMLAAAMLAAATGGLQAQVDDGSGVNREYAIKAAYLSQFGRYVQWPADAFADNVAPLVIGVLGPDPFGSILDEIARTKRIEGRPIVARRLASMADYTPCHILFVASSAGAEQRAAAIRKAQTAPILLVGEEPGFAQQGGTINFFIEENKVRFEINTEVAKRERLKISSKLLSLARLVGEQ